MDGVDVGAGVAEGVTLAEGVGVGEPGSPMITLPVGAAEGSVTGGFGLVVGGSTWPSFWQATIERTPARANPAR